MTGLRRAATLPLILGVALAGCQDAGPTPSPRAVAVVGSHELTVGEAVSLLSQQTQLPAETQVVQALAELWTDYTLLAGAALEDSALAAVDLSSIIDQRIEVELLGMLREAEIDFDTAISDTELEATYEAELPGGRVHARHILLSYEQGNDAARDSAEALALDLRARIVAGGSFQDLAAEYSQDPSSAAKGGDLGFFTRPDMVPVFADAAFALQPGEVSQPVETIYGFHIIRSEERQATPLDSIRVQYRNSLLSRRFQEAESLFVATLDAEANPEVADGYLEVLRSLAGNPGAQLSRRASRRPLVEYASGAFTARDLQEYVQAQSPAWRDQAARAPAEQVEPFILDLARREIMIDKAQASGFEIAEASQDTFRIDARAILVDAASRLGLRNQTPAVGETVDQAVDRLVMQTLSDMMAGRAQVVPLGAISYALRDGTVPRTLQSGVQQTVDSLVAWRAAQPPPPAALPDSTG